jgi:hypothetical protein
MRRLARGRRSPRRCSLRAAGRDLLAAGVTAQRPDLRVALLRISSLRPGNVAAQRIEGGCVQRRLSPVGGTHRCKSRLHPRRVIGAAGRRAPRRSGILGEGSVDTPRLRSAAPPTAATARAATGPGTDRSRRRRLGRRPRRLPRHRLGDERKERPPRDYRAEPDQHDVVQQKERLARDERSSGADERRSGSRNQHHGQRDHQDR